MSCKLALGSVQFGLDYGVANRDGKVGADAVAAILDQAKNHGIRVLDTAGAYGDAETVLGAAGVRDFDVITKIGRIDAPLGGVEREVRAQLHAALMKLNCPNLHAVLLHAPDQVLDDPATGREIITTLDAVRREGLVEKIGISVYEPDQTVRLLEHFSPDIVQLPMCPLDRRWDESGLLTRLKSLGAEVHVRSVFLQGLLLMRPQDLPGWAQPWRGLIADWRDWARGQGVTPAQAALSLTLARPDIDYAVIGVQNEAQLADAIAAEHLTIAALPDRLRLTDPRLLDPRYWEAGKT